MADVAHEEVLLSRCLEPECDDSKKQANVANDESVSDTVTFIVFNLNFYFTSEKEPKTRCTVASVPGQYPNLVHTNVAIERN